MATGGWDIPSAWEPARECARTGGTLLLLGPTDSGKSTLAAVLANDALAAGRTVALVDADVGQSNIGPPTCVSLARLTRPVAALSELPVARLDFVGSPSPVGHLLGTVTSTQAMVQAAREGAETVIVDTTGLVSGGIARALKGAKVRLLDPDSIVAVQSENEVEHLLAPYRLRTRPQIIRLRPSRHVKTRSRTERNGNRQRLFSAYFSAARVHALDWKQIPMENTPWTTGAPLPGHLRAHAEALLGQPVLHAERGADGLLLIVSGPVGRAGLQEVEEAFGSVRVLDASVFTNLLVGLLGAQGETLALAIVERVDFRAGRLEVFTPLADPGPVRAVRLGFLQLARDGTQLAWLDPSDVG